MKLVLRLENALPLFMAFLILGTLWKQGWQHVASKAKRGSVAAALAGAAAYQYP